MSLSIIGERRACYVYLLTVDRLLLNSIHLPIAIRDTPSRLGPMMILASCIPASLLYVQSFQAFVERELDSDGDGRVTERDVFFFLQTVWGSLQEAKRISRAVKDARPTSSNSRPRTLDDVHRGLGRRRTRFRQIASKRGDSRDGRVPRVWEKTLLQAAL